MAFLCALKGRFLLAAEAGVPDTGGGGGSGSVLGDGGFLSGYLTEEAQALPTDPSMEGSY